MPACTVRFSIKFFDKKSRLKSRLKWLSRPVPVPGQKRQIPAGIPVPPVSRPIPGGLYIITVYYLSILCLSGVLELVAEDFSNISGRKNIQKEQMAILYGPINGPKLCVTVIMVHWSLGTLITVTT